MNNVQQEVEIWQCENCHVVKYHEEEVWCWECGKGEMIYQGKRWIPAEFEKYVPDNRSFLRRIIEFPFRLFRRED